MIHARRYKPKVKTNKRKAIISAAIEIFARKGYNDAGISDIAQRANVANGTVYLYFKNKDDLLLQSMQEVMSVSLVEIKKKVAPIKNAVEKLFQFFVEHVELFTQNPNMARFLVVELRQCEEFYKKHPSYNPYNEYLHYVQEICTQSIKEKTTRNYDPQTLSFVIVGAMDMVLTQWVINPDGVNLPRLNAEIRDILHFGMGEPEA